MSTPASCTLRPTPPELESTAHAMTRSSDEHHGHEQRAGAASVAGRDPSGQVRRRAEVRGPCRRLRLGLHDQRRVRRRLRVDIIHGGVNPPTWPPRIGTHPRKALACPRPRPTARRRADGATDVRRGSCRHDEAVRGSRRDRHGRRPGHRARARAAARPPRRQGRGQRPRRLDGRRGQRRRPGPAGGRRDQGAWAARPSPTPTTSATGTAPSASCSPAIDTFGGLDVLINNAGILPRPHAHQHERGGVGRRDQGAPQGHLRPVPPRRRLLARALEGRRDERRPHHQHHRRRRASTATSGRRTTAPPRPASPASRSSPPWSSAATASR